MIKFMHLFFFEFMTDIMNTAASSSSEAVGHQRRAGKYAFWFRNRDVVVNQLLSCDMPIGCLFLDQIKREKGVWWMPWQ